ncbi:MAG: S-adenosylmethionine:tRNA ribosyltransferase-isomerase [Candidatus Xenobia bacterium]
MFKINEATVPPEARGLARDEVRMLVSQHGEVAHARFLDLPQYLGPGDLLVVNDSLTIPAAVNAEDGTPIHFSTQFDTTWLVEPRQPAPARLLKLPGGVTLELLESRGRLWEARVSGTDDVVAWLQRWGHPVAYAYTEGRWPIEAYQTLFGRHPGSAEMPSAGRPFTPRVLERLAARGVELAAITLHTGVSSVESGERPYPERFNVPAATLQKIRRARRVIAVGTTVVRALESDTTSGVTDLMVTPDQGLRVCHGLLTGLHEPRATHLLMLQAFLSSERLAAAYQEAHAAGYLWHEFGDVHLII